MDIYSNFDEKKNFFNGNYIITNIKILKTKLDELSGPGLFFRGVDNASYKIYSSIQRKFCAIKNNYPHLTLSEYSNEILDAFNKSKVLMQAFHKEVLSDKSEVAKWAFIQHFGGPSHLVDFTPKMEMALFFATSEGKKKMSYSTNKLDMNDYISIYAVTSNPYEVGNINYMYENDYEWAANMAKEFQAQNLNIRLDTSQVDEDAISQPLMNEFWGISIYGEASTTITIPGTGDKIENNYSNSHIYRQQGNFFMGNIENIIPLENAPLLSGRVNNIQDGTFSYYPKITCLNIHKCLIPEIRKIYKLPQKSEVYTSSCYLRQAKKELSQLGIMKVNNSSNLFVRLYNSIKRRLSNF